MILWATEDFQGNLWGREVYIGNLKMQFGCVPHQLLNCKTLNFQIELNFFTTHLGGDLGDWGQLSAFCPHIDCISIWIP